MHFDVVDDTIAIEPELVVVAGFTGRDQAAVAAHIAELRAEGVRPPDTTPTYYLLPAAAARQTGAITVAGDRTSGEAELALIVDGDRRYVTLASDHTDRHAETIDIDLSKRTCPKVVARLAWPLEKIGDLDGLRLRSWIPGPDGEAVLYQDGLAGSLIPAIELADGLRFDRPVERYLMLCGTVPVIGAIRHGDRFTASLDDPASGEVIELAYDIEMLPSLA